MNLASPVRMKRLTRLIVAQLLGAGGSAFDMGVGVLLSAATYALTGISPSVSTLVAGGIGACIAGIVLAITRAWLESKQRSQDR